MIISEQVDDQREQQRRHDDAFSFILCLVRHYHKHRRSSCHVRCEKSSEDENQNA